MVAAGDIGLASKTLNGWIFWRPSAEPAVETVRQPSTNYDDVMRQITEALDAGCELTIARDRDRFVASLCGAYHNVFAQNEEVALVIADVVGKWKRQAVS